MKRSLFIFLLFGFALATGFWFGQRSDPVPLQPINPASARLAYVCPMHSNIVQDHPGTCPICGMDLVLAGQNESGAQIFVDTATRQKFGVRLAPAERTSLAHEIHTYATLTPDVNTTQRITPEVEGTLVKLYATHPGQYIAAGKPLYDIFSQDLLQLQNEYIDYLKRRSQSYASADETRIRNRQMMDSLHAQDPAGQKKIDQAMQQTEDQINAMLQPMERDGLRLSGRLKSAGFNDAMLLQLAKQRTAAQVTTIPALRDCTVSDVSARAGIALTAMTDILTCVESSRAWLEVVFYPDQSSEIHEGQTLQIQFSDGTRTQTKLSGLSNITEGPTRTLRARMPIKIKVNQRLGTYADVTLFSSPHEALSVPVSAVIRTGHGDFVMRAMGNGHFMPQKIETGLANDERIEIRAGLETQDQVALNGQFLLDAAASIADAAQRYEQHTETAH